MLGGLVGAPLAHAQVAEHAVPFVDLAQGESFTAGAPMVKVAGNARQTAELARLADHADLVAQLGAVDLRRHRIVGVFAGPMASSGHRVSVKDIVAGTDSVRITVELIRPGPDQNVNDVISYPYAIVAVPRSALPPRAMWTVVSADSKPLIAPRRR